MRFEVRYTGPGAISLGTLRFEYIGCFSPVNIITNEEQNSFVLEAPHTDDLRAVLTPTEHWTIANEQCIGDPD